MPETDYDIFAGIGGLDLSVLEKDTPQGDQPKDLHADTADAPKIPERKPATAKEEIGLRLAKTGIPQETDLVTETETKAEAEGEPKDIQKKPDEPKDPRKESPFRLFANILKDKGSISQIPDDFTEDDDGINALIEKELEQRKTEWIDSLPETAKYFVDSYREGVPLNQLLRKEADIDSYEAITTEDLKDESTAKSIIKDYYRRIGWTSAEIKQELDANEEPEALESKAKMFLGKLVQIEKKERDDLIAESIEKKRLKQSHQKDQVNSLRNTLKDKKEIIPGAKLTDTERRAIFEGITRFDNEGKNKIMRFREANPDFDLLISYVALVLNGDITKMLGTATTKAARDIKNALDTAPEQKPVKTNFDVQAIENALKNKPF